MFTGVIEAIGKVVSLRPGTTATRLEIEMGGLLDELSAGASVAVNGVCLTLAQQRGTVAGFDVVPESWRQTTLRLLTTGDQVNLERALRVGDRLDGHFVQGHVDGIGTIERIEHAAGEHRVWITAEAALIPYIVRKGAVALDGTSLTVVDVDGERFSVVLVPTTLERTTLGQRRAGHKVNIETDLLARLVVSRLDALARSEEAGATGGITWERLREAGYMS
jgi:riboflavin synthase alpha subunit